MNTIQTAIQEAKKMIEFMNIRKNDTQDKTIIGMAEASIVTLQELIGRLEELPEDDGWIPVTDRLPEEGQKIYIYPQEESCIFSVTMKGDGDDNRFYDKEGKYVCDFEITHWKPLPLPPKN